MAAITEVQPTVILQCKGGDWFINLDEFHFEDCNQEHCAGLISISFEKALVLTYNEGYKSDSMCLFIRGTDGVSR